MRLKYGSVRTWSELCGRTFASKAEAERAEELKLLEMAGEISDLQFQVPFLLSERPKIAITIDFSYVENGQKIYEDVKGVLTRDFRSKLAWLGQAKGIKVKLIRR